MKFFQAVFFFFLLFQAWVWKVKKIIWGKNVGNVLALELVSSLSEHNKIFFWKNEEIFQGWLFLCCGNGAGNYPR